MRAGLDRKHLSFGIALSLLVHGMLLWLPPRRPSPESPSTETIELEFVYEEAPAEAPEARPEEAPAVGPARGRPPAEGPAVARPASGKSPSEAQRDLPPSVEADSRRPAPEKEPVVRREEDGVWREEALPRLDLDCRPKLPPPEVEEAPEGDGEGSAISEAEQIEDRLEEYFRDKRAEENARSRVEPAIAQLRQRLDRRFTVPMEVLEEAPRNFNLGVGDALRAYLIQAKRYGETGNPYGEDFLAPGAPGGPDTVASTVFRYRHADAAKAPPSPPPPPRSPPWSLESKS